MYFLQGGIQHIGFELVIWRRICFYHFYSFVNCSFEWNLSLWLVLVRYRMSPALGPLHQYDFGQASTGFSQVKLYAPLHNFSAFSLLHHWHFWVSFHIQYRSSSEYFSTHLALITDMRHCHVLTEVEVVNFGLTLPQRLLDWLLAE